MKVSFDKWYPIVQPTVGAYADSFAKRVERLDAERSLQVQIDKQVKKFHQYEWEIYQYRMRQLVLNIEVVNQKRQIDELA